MMNTHQTHNTNEFASKINDASKSISIEATALLTVILHDSYHGSLSWHDDSHDLSRQYMTECIFNFITCHRSSNQAVWVDKLKLLVKFVEQRLYFTASNILE
jgi:hypothetical protein